MVRGHEDMPCVLLCLVYEVSQDLSKGNLILPVCVSVEPRLIGFCSNEKCSIKERNGSLRCAEIKCTLMHRKVLCGASSAWRR